MKPHRFFAILVPFLALTGTLSAATVTADSGNTSVDTTNWFNSLSVSMHRATAAVLENPGSNSGIDEPLRVNATNRALLSSQPTLPEWNSLVSSGLVADGVTPLLFRVARTDVPSAVGDTYELVLQPGDGVSGSYVGSPQALLQVAGVYACSERTFVTLSASQPEAFVIIQPVRPEDLQPNALGEVRLRLAVKDAVSGLTKKSFNFAIRRPPLVLVHGYNSDENGWSSAFRNTADDGRALEFLIRVGYGTANGNEGNIYGSLLPLAATLSEELRKQVEKSAVLSQWAWTRYDAVGHSQGGVLLRMLCSQSQLIGGANISTLGFPAFRNGDNQYRGRFRRVVTIGSPHAGSTLAEMGFGLRNVGVPFRIRYDGLLSIDRQATLDTLSKKVLQPKFRVGNGSQLDVINNLLLCDPLARLHLLQTTIYGGYAPGTNGQDYGTLQYLFYSGLYLDQSTPTVPNPATSQNEVPGVVVAPNGSDGVVDSNSQTAGGGGNKSSAIVEQNIAHATLGETDMESSVVAAKVRDLLDGAGSQFGSVTIPQSLKNFMEDRRVRIGLLAQAIKDDQTAVAAACFLPTAPASAQLVLPQKPAPQATLAPGDETLQFALQPPPGETLNGMVEWTAVVYGPAGANPVLTLVASGTYGEQLALTIPASLQGQVVLSVRFPSMSGTTVLGTPQVVLSRPPGSVLTGIVLDPASIQSQIGAEVALAVSGMYDGAVSSRLFTNASNCAFESSNAAVAAVDAEGRVKLLSLGTATITATYNGTLTATTAVTVLDVAPIVTSAASVSGAVGQVLSHQLTASQAVPSFAAAPLPPGLTLNPQTGLITGTPTTEGATSALVSVTNANGTGSKQVDFTIAGPVGAPTDVGLDAAGVNSGKPVGTAVGRLVTIDPNPLDTFTYQLVSGTGSTDNGLFTIAGDTLVTGAVLNGAVTSTVSIRVRTTDSSGANLEKALVLPVGMPPTITRQPDSRVVFVAENAVFFVETTGLEPLQYQWKRNGEDVPGATSRIFEVPVAALADEGNYTVTVTNGDGSVTSAAASLVVNPISYGRWASVLPSGMQSAFFEPEADYNADGIVNFLDFAFGVQPGLEAGVGAQPFVSRDALGYLLIYREANGITPLTYRILISTDLSAWTEHVPALGEVTRVDRGSHTEVQVRVPPPNPGQYFSVEVSSP